MMRKKFIMGFVSVLCTLWLFGCAHLANDNGGQVQSYPIPDVESGWIREGKPIEYDGKKWFPVNDVEILLDAEVYQISEYKGVQVFVDKVDTKPYKRLYTKFAKNKFRYFERRNND